MNYEQIEKQMNELKELTAPIMKWLAENKHPHCKILIDNNSAELVEGLIVVTNDEFITD